MNNHNIEKIITNMRKIPWSFKAAKSFLNKTENPEAIGATTDRN